MAVETRNCEKCGTDFRTNTGYRYCEKCRGRVKDELRSEGYTKAVPGQTMPQALRSKLWRLLGRRR